MEVVEERTEKDRPFVPETTAKLCLFGREGEEKGKIGKGEALVGWDEV